jgi:hypothetical protein
VEDVLHGLEIIVDLLEVHETVADADYPRDSGLLRLLANQKLFDRVIVNKPDVGVSVEILHLSSVCVLVVM